MVLYLALTHSREASRKKHRETVKLAIELGGRESDVAGAGRIELCMHDGAQVTIAAHAESEGPDYTTIDVDAGVPTDVRLGKEDFGAMFGKLLSGEDIETGDAGFDKAVLVRGSEVMMLGVLDHATRRLVRRLVEDSGGNVDRGLVKSRIDAVHDAAKIAPVAQRTVALARVLRDRSKQSVPVLLRENAAADPLALVRLRSLQALVTHFPQHAETRSALEWAASDSEGVVRLFAATHANGDSVAALIKVVEDTSLQESVRVEALTQALEALGARALPLAERLLRDPSAKVRAHAIAPIGRARRSTSLPQLLALAARATEDEERIALCEAFWRLRDPQAESVLVEWVSSAASGAVRVEAARALGRAGTAAAVEPLRKRTGFLSGELGRVATESIAAIQARLRNAGEGQLSVSDEDPGRGRVSVAVERGAVSVPPPGKQTTK